MSLLIRHQFQALLYANTCLRFKSSGATTSWFSQLKKSPDRRYLKMMMQNASPNSLVVHKLPWQASKEDVHDYFSQFGQIEKVVFPYDSKGFPHKCAEVAFRDASCISSVIDNSGHFICSTPVAIRYPRGYKVKEKHDFLLYGI